MPQVLDYVSQKAEMYELERQFNGTPVRVSGTTVCVRVIRIWVFHVTLPQRTRDALNPAGWNTLILAFYSPVWACAAWSRKVDIAEMEARRYKQLTRKFGATVVCD